MTGPIQLVVASHNPVKIQAVANGFSRMFPAQLFHLEPLDAPSGVAAQPRSEGETLTGARSRAETAAALRPAADYWIGIEGGIEDGPEGMLAFAWTVIRSRERTGRARSGAFPLPDPVAALIRSGMELGEADDLVFGRENSKQAEGAVGLLTGRVVDRLRLYEQAVVLALIPFKNPDLYPPEPPV